MKKVEAKRMFEEMYGGEEAVVAAAKNDYLSVQFDWSCFVDGLCKDGQITEQQYDSWLCPWDRYRKG